jgi:protease-4
MNNLIKKATQILYRHKSVIFSCIGLILILIAINILSTGIYNRFIKSEGSTDLVSTEGEQSNSSATASSCNVLGINLHGELYTYIPEKNSDELMSNKDVVASESIMSSIQQAQNDDDIKAIIIEVDSPGGYPVAGEEVANAIKESTKPVVAFIRQTGASAAYWAISSADKIFASKNSDVGSIGVTTSYLDNVSKNKKEGLTYVQLSAGKYKDAGNPDKPLTEDEKALIVRDLKIVHENFIQTIATNRNIPIEKVRAIADGSTVLGDKAKQLGLIDSIGGYSEVKKYIEEKIGEKPQVCW